MSLNESIVENAAVEWLWDLGYAVSHGQHLEPGEPAAEQDSFSKVALVRLSRKPIQRLNLAHPSGPLANLHDAVLSRELSVTEAEKEVEL